MGNYLYYWWRGSPQTASNCRKYRINLYRLLTRKERCLIRTEERSK